MKIDIKNSSQDFTKYYLTRFVDPKVKDHSFFKEIAKDLKVDLDKLQGLGITGREIFDFVAKDEIGKFQDFIPLILKEYQPINETNLNILEKTLSPLINKYFKYLEKLFGIKVNIDKFDLLLIPTRVEKKPKQKNYFASVHKGKPTSIFLVVYINDNLNNKETLNMYLKVFFHEFTHVFLNKAKDLDNILLNIINTEYQDLSINFERIERPIKELISTCMSFAIYDFGLAFHLFDWIEDLKVKERVIVNNKFISLTRDFLIKLENGGEKNKLEKYLGQYVDELIKSDLLKATHKDLYKF